MRRRDLPALRRVGLVATLLATVLGPPAGLAAQADSGFRARGPSPFLVKYGKWAALVASVGMGIKAASAHSDADEAYDRLEAYCRPDEDRCDTGPGGRYLDPVSERHYQRAITRDRHARGWLLGGEAALLGAAGLFVWELARPRERPDNIPFEPEVTVTPRRTRLGLRVSF